MDIRIQHHGALYPKEELGRIRLYLKKTFKVRNCPKLYRYLSYGPQTQINGKRNIVCHICGVDNMYKLADLEGHFRGESHKKNCMSNKFEKIFPRAHQILYAYEGTKPIYFTIHSGENIPFMEKKYEVRLVNRVQTTETTLPTVRLNGDPCNLFTVKNPLLGVDFVLHMLETEEPLLYCFLCDKFCKQSVYEHVISYNHEYIYIERYFPRLYEKAKRALKTKDSIAKKRLLHHVFRRLYGIIAKKKGYKNVRGAVYKIFVENLEEYKRQAMSKLFIYDEKIFDMLERKMYDLIETCNEDGDKLGFYPPRLPDLIRSNDNQLVKEQFWKDMAKLDIPESVKVPDSQRYFYEKQKSWQELQEKYQKYEELPESHPDYKMEWQKYYVNTCRALRKAGTPIENYDFEKDWFPYFEKYRAEAFRKEWDSINIELKYSLNIPLSPKEDKMSVEKSHGSDAINGEDLLRILRVLSALEHHLGSFAPKCLELLGEAAFKAKTNQIDDLLSNQDNLVFLGAVREKLKGRLELKAFKTEIEQKVKNVIHEISFLENKMQEKINYSNTNSNCDFDRNQRHSYTRDKKRNTPGPVESLASDSNTHEPYIAANSQRAQSSQNRLHYEPTPTNSSISPLGNASERHMEHMSDIWNKGTSGEFDGFKQQNFDCNYANKESSNINTSFGIDTVPNTLATGYGAKRRKFDNAVQQNVDLNYASKGSSMSFGIDTVFERNSDKQENIRQEQCLGRNSVSIRKQNDNQNKYQQNIPLEGGSNWTDRTNDRSEYFKSPTFADHRTGDPSQSFHSDFREENRNSGQFYNEPNFSRSSPENSSWRDGNARNQEYSTPSNFENNRADSLSQNSNYGYSSTRYDVGKTDAEFRRDHVEYENREESIDRRERDYLSHGANIYDRTESRDLTSNRNPIDSMRNYGSSWKYGGRLH